MDVETRNLRAKYDAEVGVYCICLIEVTNGKNTIYKYHDVRKAVTYIQSYLDKGYCMICHNAKFDYAVLKQRGLVWQIDGQSLSIMCTMVMEYIRATNLPSYSLDALTGQKTNVVQSFVEAGLLDKEITLAKFWETDWSGSPEAVALITKYCVDDLKATYSLYRDLMEWYNRPPNRKFAGTLQQLEFPMLEVLVELECNGAHIDNKLLSDMGQDLAKQKQITSNKIKETAGLMPELKWNKEAEEFEPVANEYKSGKYKNKNNLVSHYTDNEGIALTSWLGHIPTEESGKVVYNHCNLLPYNSSTNTGHPWWLIKSTSPELLETAEKSSKTGKPSMGADYMKDLDLPDTLPLGLLVKIDKQLSLAQSIAKHIEADNRIRCDFAHTMTRTTRLATSNPNLQNITRPGTAVIDGKDYGIMFRSIFTPAPGYKMLAADLDRIELCVLAWFLHVSEHDSSMLEVINTGADIHQANADKWNVLRIVAKTLVFLLVYGGTPELILKRGMAKTIEEAQAMFDAVNNGQPSIEKCKRKVWAKLEKQGWISNPFNGRGVYPELQSRQKWIKSRGMRQSFNWLIQKTARDIMHMLVIESLPVLLDYGAKLVNLVHDEVIVECPEEYSEQLILRLNTIWQNRYDILPGIKINGDWHEGANWYEAKGS